MTKLTGLDYATRPMVELMSHPDYSPHAMRIVDRIVKMDSKQLESIDLLNIKGAKN